MSAIVKFIINIWRFKYKLPFQDRYIIISDKCTHIRVQRNCWGTGQTHLSVHLATKMLPHGPTV